jgi:DNA-binding transcriptional regulator GbsR (MarR family)
MTAPRDPVDLPPAIARFVDYLGELGPRWGLPAAACRVHALLYVTAKPVPGESIAGLLALDDEAVEEALRFLTEYRLVTQAADGAWSTSSDPWDLMLTALNERRRRELPMALATLQECQQALRADGTVGAVPARQIAKIRELVESLAAIDAQAQRLSPRTLRGFVEFSGRAAQFMDRAFGPGRRGNR